MESSGGNGGALSQRLGNLVLGVAVTVAMTALFLSGCDPGTGNALSTGAVLEALDPDPVKATVIGAVHRQVTALSVRTESVRIDPSSPIRNSH